MCSRGDAFMVSFSIVIRMPGYGRVNLLLNPICECSCEDDAVSLVLNWPASGLLMWLVLAQSARFMCLLLQRRAKQPRSDFNVGCCFRHISGRPIFFSQIALKSANSWFTVP